MSENNSVVKFVQLNCQKSHAVMSELYNYMVENKVGVALLQEPGLVPYGVAGMSQCRVFLSGDKGSAVVIADPSYECVRMEMGELGACVYVKGSFGELYVVVMNHISQTLKVYQFILKPQ